MKTIYQRRSIRRFKDVEVSKITLMKLVKAGMNAPSAGNQQPWYFIVLTERSILNEIPSFHPYASMLKTAPAAIVICADLNLEKHAGFWVQDCAAATENILLEIVDQGLGGVWLGVYPREERVTGIQRLLNLPSNIVPLSVIALGVPAEIKEPNDRFLEERVLFNQWK